MVKAWETIASYVEKHHLNKAVAMSATLFSDNAVSHFHEILKKKMFLDSFYRKKVLGMDSNFFN